MSLSQGQLRDLHFITCSNTLEETLVRSYDGKEIWVMGEDVISMWELEI